MARHPPQPRREECLVAVRKRLDATPEGHIVDWKPVYDAFPEIPRTTIMTWGKRTRSTIPSRSELNAAAQNIRDRAEAGVIDHLPSVPAPSAIARDDKALRRLDFAVEIPKLYADAEMLRQFSVKDVDGIEKIRNPVAFEKSIKARAGLIETSLKVLQEVWDMRAMQEFNEMIVEEIGKADIETQRRIVQRLAILNQRYGINFHGMRA